MQHLVSWKILWQIANGPVTSVPLTSTIQSLVFYMYYEIACTIKNEEVSFLFSCCLNFGTCSFQAAPAAQRQRVVSVLFDSRFFFLFTKLQNIWLAAGLITVFAAPCASECWAPSNLFNQLKVIVVFSPRGLTNTWDVSVETSIIPFNCINCTSKQSMPKGWAQKNCGRTFTPRF